MSWSKCRFGADQTLINVKTIEKKNVLDPKLGFMKRKQISFWMYWLFQPSGVVNDWWYNLSLNFKKKHFKQRFHEFQRFRNCAWQPSKYVIIWNIFFYSSLKNDVFMFSVKSFYSLFFSRFLHNNNLLNNLFFIYQKKAFRVENNENWSHDIFWIYQCEMKTIFE